MLRSILIFLVLLPAGAAANATDSCRNLYRLTDLNYAVEPGIEVGENNGVAAHCRINAVINRAIQVQVRLPSNWNGRFMFSTVGGGAGQIGDTTSLLTRGFAMASTDTGHEGQTMSFMAQPEALIDYAYRGVHLATRFAKKVIQTYYDQDIRYSYLQGCSNGGRAAMLEAIRFPHDYDGIIAGAPAIRFEEFAPWMMGGARQQAKAPVTKASLRILDDASRAACDTLDGVADGVINDPRLCTNAHFDVNELICAKGKRENCLHKTQAETAKWMYTDVKDNEGNIISPGVLPGAEAAGDWAFWILDNPLLGSTSLIGGMASTIGLLMRKDTTFNVEEFDIINDRKKLTAHLSIVDVQTADLSEFAASGGKLLMYQGWNDYPLRPQRAINYLHQVEQHHGGEANVQNFFRLYMVPGMVHCAGGPGAWLADYVDPLTTWRESDKGPDRIIATKPPAQNLDHLAHTEDTSDHTFSRPLCVYPALARYDGNGNPDQAESFDCK